MDEVRALFPGSAWLGPLAFAATVWGIGALVLGYTLRLATNALPDRQAVHWTEYARHAHAGRVLLSTPLLMTIVLAVFAPFVIGPLSALAPIPVATLTAIGALLLGWTVRGVHERRIVGPWLTARRSVRGTASAVLGFGGGGLVALACAALCPWDGVGAIVCWGLATVVIVVYGLGFGIDVARWCGFVRPAPERVQEIVAAAAARAGRPTPPCLVLDWSSTNAIALPTRGMIGFTPRAIEELDDDALGAIAQHEIGHLAESRTKIVRRFVPNLIFVAVAGAKPMATWLGIGGMLVVFGSTMILTGLGRRGMRKREEEADDHAREHEPDPKVYAAALERIHALNYVPAVIGQRRATHPELWDRMAAAGYEPDYARPEPPQKLKGPNRRAFGLYALLLLPTVFAILLVRERAIGHGPWTEGLASVAIRLGIGHEQALFEYGNGILKERPADAATVFAFALDRDGSWPPWRLRYAEALARSGRRVEARGQLARALRDGEERGLGASWWDDLVAEARAAIDDASGR